MLLVLCAFHSLAHADQRECQPLLPGKTVEVVGDTLYTLHDDSFGTNNLFVISLRPTPTLVARVSFTKLKPTALYVDGRRIRIAGFNKDALLLVELDLAASRALRTATICALPEIEPAISDLRTIRTKHGYVIPVRDSSIDHAALVTESHWEFIRSLPPGECGRYTYSCSQKFLDTQLRSFPFDLVLVKGSTIYSLSHAGLATHDLDSLKLTSSLRWQTMRKTIPTTI